MIRTFPKIFPKWKLPKGIFPSGNFPRVFFEVASSQGYFYKWQRPKCAISQTATFQVVLASALSPRSVLAVALCPLAHPSCCVRPEFSLRRLRGPNLTFGKLPLGKLHIWKVVT